MDFDDIADLNAWLNDTLDTSETDNVIAIAGDATNSDFHALSSAIVAKSAYIEELDLSELNVTQFYNSGNGYGGDSYDNFMDKLVNVKKIIMPETLKIINEGLHL